MYVPNVGYPGNPMTDAKSTDRNRGTDRRNLLSGLAALPVLPPLLAAAAQKAAAAEAATGFSFAACGDSRPMMYLPYNDGHPDLVRLFVEMFGWLCRSASRKKW